MTISPHDAVGHIDHNGTTYYFSQSCQGQFEADPERFLTAEADTARPATAADMDREYTCPMHPEVRQKGTRF